MPIHASKLIKGNDGFGAGWRLVTIFLPLGYGASQLIDWLYRTLHTDFHTPGIFGNGIFAVVARRKVPESVRNPLRSLDRQDRLLCFSGYSAILSTT